MIGRVVSLSWLELTGMMFFEPVSKLEIDDCFTPAVRQTAAVHNLYDAWASSFLLPANRQPEPQGSCINEAVPCATPPKGGVGQVLFVEPLGGGAGAALDRRSFFVLEPSQGVTSPPRAPLMCRTLLGWLLPLLTVSLAISGTRSFAQDTPKASSSSGGISEVIAEGAGATPDEALKDAFRNAVRQVVGAVVDAETLIKNDEVIDDQILTYSDGFVKKFDEVAGSKKSVGGLHRVKIKAQVERRSVIAKLKSAKVTVKDLDGKSLFAEAVTSAEAEENSTKLLAKALSDLPKLLTASVSSKPEYDRDKGEVVLNVDVEVDAKSYRDFSGRLQELLKKIAMSKETALLTATAVAPPDIDDPAPGLMEVRDITGIAGPPLSEKRPNLWCLWVCASSTGNNSSQRWNGYVIDADFEQSMLPFLNRSFVRANQPNTNQEAKTSIHVDLLDAEGNVIVEDEFELVSETKQAIADKRLTRHRWIGYAFPRPRSPKSLYEFLMYSDHGNSGRGVGRNLPPGDSRIDLREFPANAYLAPFAISVMRHRENLRFRTRQTYQRRIKLSLDELKLVKDVKCSVVYSPDAAATK